MSDDRKTGGGEPLDGATTTPEGMPSRLVRAEANLLRLPLFALHTKGLRTLDGIECRGKLTRDGVEHEFVYRATRNTATAYPGPLARSAHLAFLSLMTEKGFPLRNPITWSWRDLCRRMGVSCSGRTVERLKAAIRSTKGLLISSQYAIYSKAAGRLIRSHERDLGLYDEVAFVSETLPDGSVADTNHLWLADWYLANLNALFTAPLDYDLWRRLDERSSIASRLYEFLLLNFYAGAPTLRIGYEKLAQFLPVRPEKYASDARRQLGAALELLRASDVIEAAEWSEGRGGLGLLQIHRGRVLEPSRDGQEIPQASFEEDVAGAIEVEEIRDPRPPEWLLVADFYKLWAGKDGHRPTKKELEQGRAMIEQHGAAKARALVGLIVKRLKKAWPDAKSFGATLNFLDEVAGEYEKQQKRLEAERRDQSRAEAERLKRERERAEGERFEARWKPVWEAMSDSEREEMRRDVAAAHPFLEKMPRMVERLCLEQLARRAGQGAS